MLSLEKYILKNVGLCCGGSWEGSWIIMENWIFYYQVRLNLKLSMKIS